MTHPFERVQKHEWRIQMDECVRAQQSLWLRVTPGPLHPSPLQVSRLLSCRWCTSSFSIHALTASLPFLPMFALIEGQKKRRNTLHEFKKSAKTTLIKEDPLLKSKSKKMSSADQCASRCTRNKGLPFTCKWVSLSSGWVSMCNTRMCTATLLLTLLFCEQRILFLWLSLSLLLSHQTEILALSQCK